MRRIALLLGVLLLLLFAVTLIAVVLVTTALEGASAGARLGAATAGVLLFLVALWLVGRSVRRTFGPIGDVMEAAERIADGDYSARVDARGPGEVRRLARTFNDMTEQLQAAEAQRRRLLADVAHELRTPLAVVRGNVEGMLDGVYDADPQRLAAVLEETDLLGRLLDDLQTLSTAEAGALRLHREATDLGALAADVVMAFEPRASAKRIELSSRSDALPDVGVDPARMRQVLENLLANALQHTPAGGVVTIDVSARDDAVELAVSDTGPGISKDELGSVFDRYTRSSDSGGSGLGLAIAKSLVELHGGSIQAESPPGGGTTIRTRLPAIA